MSGYHDEIFILARDVFRGFGGFEPNVNPKFIRQHYDDGKIRMTMYVDVSTQEAVELSISLSMSSDGLPSSLPSKPFSLGNTAKDEKGILVYQWQQVPVYSRPGLWKKYLRNLAEEHRKRWQEVDRFSDVPVDDSSLFPEINND